MKLFMEQQTKQLQQQTLQWEQQFEARTNAEGKKMAGGTVEEERDEREIHLREE